MLRGKMRADTGILGLRLRGLLLYFPCPPVSTNPPPTPSSSLARVPACLPVPEPARVPARGCGCVRVRVGARQACVYARAREAGLVNQSRGGGISAGVFRPPRYQWAVS